MKLGICWHGMRTPLSCLHPHVMTQNNYREMQEPRGILLAITCVSLAHVM
jgi:hypothetical protein